MDQQFKDRMFNLTKGSASEQSAGRTEIWKYGIRIIGDYPFGTGGGGFQNLSTRYLPAHLIEESVGARASHNTYLCIFIEQGYLGLILYLCFIASLFIYLSKTKANISNVDNESAIFVNAQTIAIQSGLAGFFTASFFVDRIYFEGVYLVSSMVPVLYNISIDLKHEFSDNISLR